MYPSLENGEGFLFLSKYAIIPQSKNVDRKTVEDL
jgi:hypothetical protein